MGGRWDPFKNRKQNCMISLLLSLGYWGDCLWQVSGVQPWKLHFAVQNRSRPFLPLWTARLSLLPFGAQQEQFFSPALQRWLGTAVTLTVSIQPKARREADIAGLELPRHDSTPMSHQNCFISSFFCSREKVVLRRDLTCNLLGSFFQRFWQHWRLMDKNSFYRCFFVPVPHWSEGVLEPRRFGCCLVFFPLFFLSAAWSGEGHFAVTLSFSLAQTGRYTGHHLGGRGFSFHLVSFVPEESTRLSTFVSSSYCCYFSCGCYPN